MSEAQPAQRAWQFEDRIEVPDLDGNVRAAVRRESKREACPFFVECDTYLTVREARKLAAALFKAVEDHAKRVAHA